MFFIFTPKVWGLMMQFDFCIFFPKKKKHPPPPPTASASGLGLCQLSAAAAAICVESCDASDLSCEANLVNFAVFLADEILPTLQTGVHGSDRNDR